MCIRDRFQFKKEFYSPFQTAPWDKYFQNPTTLKTLYTNLPTMKITIPKLKSTPSQITALKIRKARIIIISGSTLQEQELPILIEEKSLPRVWAFYRICTNGGKVKGMNLKTLLQWINSFIFHLEWTFHTVLPMQIKKLVLGFDFQFHFY